MKEAMEAQLSLLTGEQVGSADFRSVGKLEDLVREYEAPLRKTTAQVDTDVLRQTLLGGQRTTDSQGRIVTGYEGGEALGSGEFDLVFATTFDGSVSAPGGAHDGTFYTTAKLVDKDGKTVSTTTSDKRVSTNRPYPDLDSAGEKRRAVGALLTQAKSENLISDAQAKTIEGYGFDGNWDQSVKVSNDGTASERTPVYEIDPQTGGPKIYKDADGNVAAGTSVRAGEGMVDLVGDTRDVMRAAAPTLDYKSYIEGQPDLLETFHEARREGDTRSIEEYGKDHYEAFGKAEGREIGKIYGQDLVSAGREAGFDDTGKFLGLSALAEDIQAGNLSRQRERDLQDVARLSPLYSDIMDKYKPGTKEALESAQAVLKAREGDLTGAGAIDAPAPTTPEAAALQDRLSTGMGITAPIGSAPTGYDATRVASPSSLTAATGYDAATAAAIDPLSAATGYDASATAAARDLSAPTSYTADTGVAAGRIGGLLEPDRESIVRSDIDSDWASKVDAISQREPSSWHGGIPYFGPDASKTVSEEDYNALVARSGGDAPSYADWKRGYTESTQTTAGTSDIRRALMEDAYTGLGEGLTAREKENIEQASRRRATALGRAFDRGSIADEVQSRVLEDRNRQAQNRAYAQQVLGQEAGLQTSDMGRSLQAQLANQQAANQAASMGMQAGIQQEQAGAAQDLQAQLANQQAINRQREFGVQAGMQQEQAGAQFAQQKALSDQAAANQAAQYGIGAGLQQESLGAQMGQQKALADAQAANQAAQYGVGAGLQQQQFGAGQDLAAQAMNREAAMKASEFDILQDVARRDTDIARAQQAKQFDVGMTVDQQRLNEQLAQQGTLGYIDAATRLAALEDTSTLDPFQAVLGRAGGGSLQAGQGVFGGAKYGLESGPQYLRPEAGLGFIQNQATNAANMFNAQQAAGATRSAGMMGGLGSMFGALGGAAITKFCWVAREVYGAHNPAWLDFRQWMFSSAPRWFFKLYLTFGERFANFISNKPRLKARIRRWMDSKIGR